MKITNQVYLNNGLIFIKNHLSFEFKVVLGLGYLLGMFIFYKKVS